MLLVNLESLGQIQCIPINDEPIVDGFNDEEVYNNRLNRHVKWQYELTPQQAALLASTDLSSSSPEFN